MKNRLNTNARRQSSPPRSLLAAVLFQLLVCSLTAFAQTPTPSPTPSPAATPPATDIFVVEVVSRGSLWRFGRPANVTRREGYDNQPHFMPGGRSLLYTSIREDRQADIYRYDLPTGATARVTATAEDEYSPTVMPGGRSFSVVRVEADKTQRLWRFPAAGGDSAAASLVLERVKPVGYHAWVDDDARLLALFVLGTPNTLQLADARTGNSEVILGNVGRALQRVPKGRAFSFVHKVSDKEWLIKSFDLRTRAVNTLAPTVPASEDYVWTPDGGALLMAKGSKLFMRRLGPGGDWREVADFSSDGLKDITRLAISPDGRRLALVARP